MRTTPRLILFICFFVVSSIALVSIFSFSKTNEGEGTVDVKNGRLQYKWFAPELPTFLSFAGEKVPLERQEVREQLDRELLYNYYNQYSTIYILKLAGRYLPMIEPLLRANGMHDDFKYLCIAESALQNQISKAGAVGFWQFMPGTAPQFGLEVNDEIDERYNVVKSTEAACRYFKQAYAKLGSWTAAAASYNMGMGGYSNQSNFQQKTNYYDLLLPDETMRYVFRILALKLLIGEANKFGYIVTSKDTYKPIPTKSIIIESSIPNLAQFAIDKGTSYRTLKQLNPWLRDKKLTVKPGKRYEVLLPAM
ncbi:MAG: lytic transglycosylase domain-containing protein [Bacteroidetes bacterium]|nr:lytic transglycosylase domain-containing protein [Bacteroidota bacterium]MBS1739201.1 lytic transglycosylase domain-containing protein [Bacteroidota bacterium]MBS1775650.1 lytic transglycosylase domain-containing protein [Bacteroidota bacterium]